MGISLDILYFPEIDSRVDANFYDVDKTNAGGMCTG